MADLIQILVFITAILWIAHSVMFSRQPLQSVAMAILCMVSLILSHLI